VWILRTKKGVVVVSTGMLWLLCFLVIVALFLSFLVSLHTIAWMLLAAVFPIWCIGLYAFFEYLANGFISLDFQERTLMKKSPIFAKRKRIIPLDQIREIHTHSKRNADGPDLKTLSLELQSGEHVAILPGYCTDFVNIGRLQNILREEVAKTKSQTGLDSSVV
jgi:membrane protein YdbS with pleckstrin-like domain